MKETAITRERDIVGLHIVKKSPHQKPQFYTDHEGGKWIDWSDRAGFDYEWLRLRNGETVEMDELKVHSLAFGHVSAGWDKFQRWDCINGFNNFVFEPLW